MSSVALQSEGVESQLSGVGVYHGRSSDCKQRLTMMIHLEMKSSVRRVAWFLLAIATLQSGEAWAQDARRRRPSIALVRC